MTPLNEKSKKDLTNHLVSAVNKLLDSPELNDLNESQLETIAKGYYLDTLKQDFQREVKKARLNNDAVQDLVNQWLSGFKSKHTVRSFKKNLYLFLDWLKGTSLIDVNARLVDKYISYINSDKNISDNTKRQRIAACSSFFSNLERWEVINRNPFKGAKGLPKKKIAVKQS